VRRVRRLRSRRQQQLVHVLHLRSIRVEQWSPEALTSASRRDFPVTPIRSARSKSGSVRTWSSSARERVRGRLDAPGSSRSRRPGDVPILLTIVREGFEGERRRQIPGT
jgi:hypothetical protein